MGERSAFPTCVTTHKFSLCSVTRPTLQYRGVNTAARGTPQLEETGLITLPNCETLCHSSRHSVSFERILHLVNSGV